MTLALGQLGIALCVLLIPVGLVALVHGSLERARKRERPRPDYDAIAAMELPIWGRTFEHAGNPVAEMERELFGKTTGPEVAAPSYWHCDEGEHRSNLRWN